MLYKSLPAGFAQAFASGPPSPSLSLAALVSCGRISGVMAVPLVLDILCALQTLYLPLL